MLKDLKLIIFGVPGCPEVIFWNIILWHPGHLRRSLGYSRIVNKWCEALSSISSYSGGPPGWNSRIQHFLCFEGRIFNISAPRLLVSLISRNGTFPKILSYNEVSDGVPQGLKYLYYLLYLRIWSWSFWVTRVTPGQFFEISFYDILGILEGL